jgi:hypothetical protein
VHAQQAGPATLPRRPNRTSLPFLLRPVADRWGPAVRLSPYLQPAGQPLPLMAAGRYRPGSALPRLQTSPSCCSEARPSFTAINQPFLLLNPHSPLIPHQRSRPLMDMPPGAPSPSLSSLFKRLQGTSAPPSPKLELLCLLVPSPPLPPIRSADRRAIAAARAPSPSVKLVNLCPSLLLRARGSHVHLFKFAGSLAASIECATADLEFWPPAPISTVAALPAALSSA